MTCAIVLASIRYRRTRLAVAALAVVLGCSLPATLVGLGAVRDGFRRELAAHGANLLVVPARGITLDAAALAVLDRFVAERRLAGYAPRVEVAGAVGARRVAVAGVRFSAERGLHPWWRVDGTWPGAAGDVIVGANVAAKLGCAPGVDVVLVTPGGTRMLRIAGVLSAGGPEDDQMLVRLDVAEALSARPRSITLVHARAADGEDVLRLAHALRRWIPDGDVRAPLAAVTTTQTVLDRVERLILMVTALTLAASALAVFSTMAAAAAERAHEVGVMKALGADGPFIRTVVSVEAGTLGVAAGALGFVLGLALTEAIAWEVFGVLVPPRLLAFGTSACVGLGVTVGASLVPIHRLVRLSPAAVLRGD